MQTDRMLYLALKALYNKLENHDIDDDLAQVYHNADLAMSQFEVEMGPLPDWASAHNITGEPVLFAQLYTRDGRKRGNGMIYHIGNSGKSFGVITDMGNTSCLNLEELLGCYEIGDFVLNEEGYAKRKRQNPELDFEEPSSE